MRSAGSAAVDEPPLSTRGRLVEPLDARLEAESPLRAPDDWLDCRERPEALWRECGWAEAEGEEEGGEREGREEEEVVED